MKFWREVAAVRGGCSAQSASIRRSVETAFDVALVQLTGAGENQSLAKLHKRRGVKPSEIVLVDPASPR